MEYGEALGNRPEQTLKQLLILLVVSVLLLSACSAPTAAPAATPAPVESTPRAAASSVVATVAGPACSLQNQSQAMRPAEAPAAATITLLPCYQLTLDLSKADTGVFVGTANITFSNTGNTDLTSLVFRLYPNAPVLFGGSLEVTSVLVDGKLHPAKELLPDHTAIGIDLKDPLKPGESLVVEMAFGGQAPRDFGSDQTYGIFNLAPDIPVLTLANWYPILAELKDGQWQYAPVSDVGDAVNSQAALFQVRVVAPQGWKIASTGENIASENESGQEITTIVSGPARDFILVTSPAFEVKEAGYQDVRLTHWRLPGAPDKDASLQVALDSVQIYSERFGPYPYKQLDVVDVPLQLASGVEYPGLVLIESSLSGSSGGRQFLPVVVSHEVAHQWWYGVVGNDVLEDPWQDEALATFSSFLYFQEHDPGYYQGMLQTFEQQVQSYQRQQGQSPIAEPVTAFENNMDGYSIVVYRKGALFFIRLREHIGDRAFFDALRSYYQKNMYQVAPPDALLSAFEDSCSCNLADFYSEWGVVPSK